MVTQHVPEPSPSPIIGTVAGQPIPAALIEPRLEGRRRGRGGRHVSPGGGTSAQQRRWVARELILEAVLRHEIAAAGLGPMTPATVQALVDRVTSDATVAEVSIEAYYRRNLDLYRRPETRRVRQVVVHDAATAWAVRGRLETGQDMAVLAAENSTDRGSRALGGDLGDIRREQFAGPFGELLFGADPGEIVGPVRTEHGWHVARVESVTPGSVVGYGAARASIEAVLLGAERSRVFDAWLEERVLALAVIEPDFAHPADPAAGIPSHRH